MTELYNKKSEEKNPHTKKNQIEKNLTFLFSALEQNTRDKVQFLPLDVLDRKVLYFVQN